MSPFLVGHLDTEKSYTEIELMRDWKVGRSRPMHSLVRPGPIIAERIF